LSEALGDRGRGAALRENSQGAGRRMMHEVVRRAVERGEVEAGAVTPRRLDVGQAMIRQYFLFNGPPIPDALIVEVVDEIIVPLLGCPAP
ncbi:TetR-like C-terminal domain-containing protein, partial [Nonomuraea sp. NPDC055795]